MKLEHMQGLIQVARPIPYVCFFCGEYGGMVSITPYGMVWYVSKHKHKDNLGMFGSVWERLEAVWKRLNAFQGFSERMGALSRLGRLGSIVQ